MVDDEEFTDREGLIVGAIALVVFILLIATAIITSTSTSISNPFSFPELGFVGWANIGLFVLIAGSIVLAIFWGSDDEGEDDVFEGGVGFPLTIGVLVIAVLLINTSFLGLSGQGSDIYAWEGGPLVPDGYVDYGSPQPYGYGDYGPKNDGVLTDGEGALAGAAIGCATGGATFALVSWIPVVGWTAVAGGCAVGALVGGGAGYSFSASDLDGDPTTGW